MTTAELVSVLAPLPVLLPLLGAGLTLVLTSRSNGQRAVSITMLTLVLGVSVTLLVVADESGTQAVQVGGWAAPLGITLVVDRVAALMLVVSSTVTLGVLVYSAGQGHQDGDAETPVSIYHPTYLILTAGVSNAFLSGDLFNLYVGFEILLVASYVLLTLGGTESRVRAGVTYVVVSLVSSVLFLSAIALVYAATGTVNLAQLSSRIAELPESTQTLLHLVLLVAFGIKAAVFPLSFWLPDSYPTAPAPVTAVFAGLLTKVGVYAIIRTETLLFPDNDMSTLLMVVAGLTLVVGILGAVAQSGIKRLLSFTLVSHIGYMVFGIGLGTVAGLAGAVFYVVHHITIQTALFLVCGLIERRGGTTSMRRLGGLATISPVLGVLFFVPAMNLAGIPPFSGFIGKLGLFSAGVDQGGWLAYVLVALGTVTSLLTLYVMARVWNLVFWRSPEEAQEPEPALTSDESVPLLPRTMVGATAATAAVGVALAFVAGPLWAVTTRAAEELVDPTGYVVAVFPTGPAHDGGVHP
jgi:multicomponent Na+:H+ antiporter subunit D